MDNITTPNPKKNQTLKIILIVIGVIIIAFVLARYVVFKSQFEEFGAGIQRIEQWQTEYKRTHPDATKEEMNAAFKSGIDNLSQWKTDYKNANPGATDAEADAAFNELWNK